MFCFRLALALGFPHPHHLLAQLTASELSQWMAYAAVEPFGEFRDELRHGQLMALHANVNRDPQARREPFRADEFMNFYDRQEQPAVETPQQSAERIRRELFRIGE